MFICNDCLEKGYRNDESLFKSRGRCEDCGESNVCNDIHSSELRPKIGRYNPMTGLLENEDGRPV